MSDEELSERVRQAAEAGPDAQQQLVAAQQAQYLEGLFLENATAPVRVRNVQVTNAQAFRAGFLEKQLAPLLQQDLVTLLALLAGIDATYQRLAALDVLESCWVGLHDLPRRPWATSPAVDVVPVLNVVPQKRFFAKSGTNVGNGEGDGYIQFQLKNLFGGAEKLSFDAVTGTKTPALYLLSYSQPVGGDGRFWWETAAFSNTRKLEHLQSTVALWGVTLLAATRFRHPLNADCLVEHCWRELSNHGLRAAAVLAHLGPAFKLAVLLNARYDTRDHPVTPTRGVLCRLGLERCGLFAFNADRYTKVVWEAQAAHLFARHRVLVTHKAGAMFGHGFLDRFHAGGPNDVRLFALQGLGPKQANSAVGGNYFTTAGLSLISHIPRTPDDSSFRWHTFLNAGRLVGAGLGLGDVARQFTTGYSVGFGTGLMYTHPQARFELNVVLPLTAHQLDYVRKGIQYGVGISFL